MKRRGFLQTLAGLCGVVAAPAIPATKPAKAVIIITGTNQFGEANMDLCEVAPQDRYGYSLQEGKYHHLEYGWKGVMRGDSLKFEKVGH